MFLILDTCASCLKPLTEDGFLAAGQLYHTACFKYIVNIYPCLSNIHPCPGVNTATRNWAKHSSRGQATPAVLNVIRRRKKTAGFARRRFLMTRFTVMTSVTTLGV